MNTIKKIAWALVIVGGLNWLLIGIFGIDIGSLFGGQEALLSRVAYILIGLSAVLLLFGNDEKCCKHSCIENK